MFRGDTQNWANAEPFRLHKDKEKEWEEGAVFSETPATPSRRLGARVIFTPPSRPGGLCGTDGRAELASVQWGFFPASGCRWPQGVSGYGHCRGRLSQRNLPDTRGQGQ